MGFFSPQIGQPSRSRAADSRRRTRLNVEALEDRRLLAVGLISFNSANTDSARTGSSFTNMSADGRYLVFQSAATDLVAGILDRTGAGGDIFVRDRLTNKTTLVTINKRNNATANYSSMNPIISANGRFVLFESLASDLTTNDHTNTRHHANVYIRDLVLKKTSLVSVTRAGLTNPSATSTVTDSPQTYGRFISDDGRYAVFQSDANDLVANDNNGHPDVFVRDLVLKKTTLVSVDGAGTRGGNFRSDHPVISADGRYVAFDSRARNLIPGVTDFQFHTKVFVRDMIAKKTILVSTDRNGKLDGINEDSFLPHISADGRVIAFESFAKLAAGDTNFFRDIYVRNLSLNHPTYVSAGVGGRASNLSSFAPALSDNGKFVAFESLASNLTTNDNDGSQIDSKDVFVRNLTTNVTTLVSINRFGTGSGNLESRNAVISGDGRFVSFESRATNLFAGFTHQHKSGYDFDIFLRDTTNRKTTLVTTAFGTTTRGGNGGSRFPVISRDGRYVSFHSTSSDLVARDTNGTNRPRGGIQTDIFVSPLAYVRKSNKDISQPLQKDVDDAIWSKFGEMSDEN